MTEGIERKNNQIRTTTYEAERVVDLQRSVRAVACLAAGVAATCLAAQEALQRRQRLERDEQNKESKKHIQSGRRGSDLDEQRFKVLETRRRDENADEAHKALCEE